MSFINRNANLLLLFLIVISAVALVGLTVFFQKNFQDVNVRYNEKLAALNKISEDLEQQQKLIEQAKVELELLRARDSDFSAKFTDVKSTKEQLEEENSDLASSKASLQQSLTLSQAKLTKAEDESAKYKNLYEALLENYDELRDENKYLKDKVEELEAQGG